MNNTLYVLALIALLGFLQWHEDYTEARIAEIEAQQVRTIACDEPVAVAKR